MSETIARLRIVLRYTDPPIWRRVEVPAECTLADLHTVIQAAMRWTNSHLYLYEVGRQSIGGPGLGEPGVDSTRAPSARRVRVADLAENGVKRFRYVYDMGDSWEHDIRIEKVFPSESPADYPRLVDGAMRAPPDDCGGVPGFYGFLEAIGDPAHPEHVHWEEWYGGAFDAEDVEADEIQRDLARIAARRKHAARKRLAAAE